METASNCSGTEVIIIEYHVKLNVNRLVPKSVAPIHRTPPQPLRGGPPPLAHRQSPVKPQKPLNVVAKVQESPKVINFEDRLKSIITSVLNEDQVRADSSYDLVYFTRV